MKKWLILLASVLIIISLTACTRKSPASPPRPQTEESAPLSGAPLKIGVLFSTTGTFSISESSMLYAAKMAIDEINASGGINGSLIPHIHCKFLIGL